MSIEIDNQMDVFLHRKWVWKYINQEVLSKGAYDIICLRLLRRVRKESSLIDFASRSDLDGRFDLQTITVLRLLGVSRLHTEIWAWRQENQEESEEKIRNLKRQMVKLLQAVLATSPELVRVELVQKKWLRHNIDSAPAAEA